MPEDAKGVLSGLGDQINSLINPAGSELKGAFAVLNNIIRTMDGIVASFSKVQSAAVELAKSTGLAGKSIMGIATRTIEQNHKMQLSAAYNMTSPEMIQLQQKLMGSLQRNVAVDNVGTVQRNANGEVVNPNFDSELENLIAATKVFGADKVASITAGFDKLGKSMKAAAKYTGKLFQEAGEYGINLEKYAENFSSNLEMAQMYNFRKGVDGLREMARKATEIRQDMKQVAAFADKVGSVTGAVETASQLQVLGGSFSALANPLSMLNESLTNMEGLQDRLTSMTEGMATYNHTTRQIEMNAYDRMRLRRAAEAMGVDPNNLIDQAYAQARRTEIMNQMQGMGNLTEGFRKLVPNVGTIDSETGAAGVTIGNEFISLSDIASMSAEKQAALQEQLIAENRSESEDIKVIAKSVMGIEAIISGKRAQMQNEAARTNILPGTVSGMSSYDMVFDFISKEINPKLMEAATNINLVAESLGTWTATTANKALITGPMSTFAAKNPEEFGQAWNDYLHEMFGDAEWVDEFGAKVQSATTSVANFVEGLNQYLTDHGFDVLPGNKENVAYAGREGSTTTPVPRNQQEDIATILAENGAEVIPYGTRNGASDLLAPITNPTGTLNNSVKFSSTQNSLPGVSVMATGGGMQAAAQGGQNTGGNGQTGNYSFNISGNLTMTVNGDNGKIGTVDLTKTLMDDSDFKRMLAYEIAKAMKEVDSRASILNQNI